MKAFTQEDALLFFGFAYASLPESILERYTFRGLSEEDIEQRKDSLPEFKNRRRARTRPEVEEGTTLQKDEPEDDGPAWGTDYIVMLEEKDNRTEEQKGWKPNGFTERSYLRDFPIRNHRVFIEIRRRRWINEEGRNVVLEDIPLAAKGSRYTSSFADFLKGKAR